MYYNCFIAAASHISVGTFHANLRWQWKLFFPHSFYNDRKTECVFLSTSLRFWSEVCTSNANFRTTQTQRVLVALVISAILYEKIFTQCLFSSTWATLVRFIHGLWLCGFSISYQLQSLVFRFISEFSPHFASARIKFLLKDLSNNIPVKSWIEIEWMRWRTMQTNWVIENFDATIDIWIFTFKPNTKLATTN